ncbi:MerR family transcriptional regulator [Methylacidiphilum caldifontis]|uniref:Transcriptional regulator n=1 Tax=Methylacidiphilum caldifontis TaxID=2795386 RepID=A0A4Y8P9L6_9BACT|nr:MerR family transcriptional regulator [Methylacidiphilum caldifontis]QSR89070.1 MerR family transcriptional regulator [Methylacidiphilum caldifontis]TFE67417.1 transcriptional regulator [Methylacidiphilum caldifontis]
MNNEEKENNQTLTILAAGEGKIRLYSLEGLSRETGVDIEIVSLYIRMGLISPCDSPHGEDLFNDDAVFLLKQFERLRLEYRMGFQAIIRFYRIFKALQK